MRTCKGGIAFAMNDHQQKPKAVKKRLYRLILGATLPVLVGAAGVWLLFSGGWHSPHVTNQHITLYSIFRDIFYAIAFYLLISAVGFILVGIQSVIYSMLMEFVVNPRIKCDYVAILIGGFLGAASGLFIQLLVFVSSVLDANPSRPTLDYADVDVFFAILGFMVGLIVSRILRRNYVRYAKGE